MKTIRQVAEITGISTRTLQYYDEINLLKPSELTASGYRLYDDEALQTLQQILFLKELGFKLKEINEILQAQDFDRLKAYHKQKELLLLKQSRLNSLIELLSRLEKGEQCMSFKEFSLSEYLEALESFKNNHMEEIKKHWGSIENFNHLIQKVKEDESKVAQLAVKQYGSVEKYTEAMKYNLEHFSEIMERQQNLNENIEDITQQLHDIYLNLTSDLNKDVTASEIQNIVHKLVSFTQKSMSVSHVGEGYWNMVIESYSNEIAKAITDTKYGTGASEYIAKALQYYFNDFTKSNSITE